MKFFHTFILTLVLCTKFYAQSLYYEWERFTWTETGGQPGLPFCRADLNGNIYVLGDTYHPGPVTGFLTTKYDTGGNLLWQVQFDSPYIDRITCATVKEMGGIYVGGSSVGQFSNSTIGILFNYDDNGNETWSFAYKGDVQGFNTGLSKVIALPQQHLLVLGTFNDLDAGEKGTFLVEINGDGNIVWAKEMLEGFAFDIVPKNQNYLMWGSRTQGSTTFWICWNITNTGEVIEIAETAPYYDGGAPYAFDAAGNLVLGDIAGKYQVTKISTSGEFLWQYAKPFVPHPNPWAVTGRSWGVAVDSLENVYFNGFYYVDSLGGYKGLVTCLDKNGNLKWEHQPTINIPKETVALPGPAIVIDNTYTIVGSYILDSINNKARPLLIFYNQDGYLSGGGILELSGEKYRPESITVANDNIFVTGSNSDSLYIQKQFICKVPIPTLSYTHNTVVQPRRLTIVYPNPTRGRCTIAFEHDQIDHMSVLRISNLNAQIVHTQMLSITSGKNEIEVDIPKGLPTGIYTMEMIVNSQIYVGQVVVRQ